MGFAEVKRSAGTSPNAVPEPLTRVVCFPRRVHSPSLAGEISSARRSVSVSVLTFSNPTRKKTITELDSDKRSYPGGYFDPLKFADTTSEEALQAEDRRAQHSRLAMVGMLGIAVQATKNGEGALERSAPSATKSLGISVTAC